MDIKSMAKSKRSHTRQNQPRKHIPHPSKPSPTSTSGNPNSEKKDGRDRKREEEAAQKPSLPSNWDRYQDEEEQDGGIELPIESNSDELSQLKTNSVSDAVKPKSKGGNLGDLIAQARESRSSYSPSFYDTLPDFHQGLGPLISVKGESILSWEGEDSFLAHDETTNTQEAPFLSLDLQDLAQQLAKVDLAKRLFIEGDILPPELRGQEAEEKSGRQNKTRVPETFDELLSLYWEEEQNAEQEKLEATDGKKSSSQKYSKSDETQKYTNLSSELKVAAAEDELDMLLNSLTDTNPFGSSNIQSDTAATSVPTKRHTTSTSSVSVSENSCVDIPVTSNSVDDALDSLLEETSQQDNNGGLSQSTQVKGISVHHPSSSSHPTSQPKVLDDFDSWFDTL